MCLLSIKIEKMMGSQLRSLQSCSFPLMSLLVNALVLNPKITQSLTLYGTKNPFLFLSPKALIQFAKANNDLLILAPYINLIPRF